MTGDRMFGRARALLTLGGCLGLGCATEPDRQLALAHMTSELRNPGHAPSVKLVDRTIEQVRESYYDKQRIEPTAMVVAAMEAVATVAPSLRVEQIAPAKLQLSSGASSRVFDLSKIASVLEVAVLFNQMHGYLTGQLQLQDESRIMGFAAANGLLSTLDPGCALISEEEFVTRRSVSADLPPEKFMVLAAIGSDLYLRLGILPLGTSRVLEQVLKTVSTGAAGRPTPRGLILDLRGNGDGVSEEALRVTGTFVESGISIRAAVGGGWIYEHRSAAPKTRWRGPMVVLVDERTASGAEVIAATLKDLDRAPLIGQRTAGVGTLQGVSEFPATDGSSKAYLYLTLATMTRPSGPRLEKLGVVPDLLVAWTEGHGPPIGFSAGRRLNPFARPPGPPGDSSERPVAEIRRRWTAPVARANVEGMLLEDLEIRLAHELLAAAPRVRRGEMLPQLERIAASAR